MQLTSPKKMANKPPIDCAFVQRIIMSFEFQSSAPLRHQRKKKKEPYFAEGTLSFNSHSLPLRSLSILIHFLPNPNPMAALSPLCSYSTFSLAPPPPPPPSLPHAALSPSIRVSIRRRQFPLLSVRAAVSAKETPAPKEPKGIRKPMPITPELQAIVGVSEIPRTQALKHIWAYIKEHELQVQNQSIVSSFIFPNF